MTLKIEKIVSRKTAIVRLTGRLSVEHLEEVLNQIKLVEMPMTLDLSELSLVSLEGVRFLNECEDKGIIVANASPYIWPGCCGNGRRGSTDDHECDSFGLVRGSGPGEAAGTRV